MIRALPAAASLALIASAQTFKFEAADVRTGSDTRRSSFQTGVVRAGRYELRHATMVDLIRTAYGIDAGKVVGGPSWLDYHHYEITAKIPPNTPADRLKPPALQAMLQALLADRFKLVVHRETRLMSGFVLSAGKGKPKLKEASGGDEKGCQFPPPDPPGPNGPPLNHIVCRGVTMDEFAGIIHQSADAYLTSPVVDSTGLKGAWDFDLRWTSKGMLAIAGSDGITVFDAVDKQLGLKLEAQKVPMPVLVVDSVNERPSPNPSNVAAALPPAAPPEFEVASIRPSQGFPDVPPRLFEPGGRVNFPSVPLTFLIYQAYDLPPGTDLPGAPKSLNSATFDLVAKAPADLMANGPNGPQIDPDDLDAMFRSLLIGRFKLQTHYEDRPVTAYTLFSVKPKLKPADPAGRTGCRSEIGPRDPGNPGPPPIQVTCWNITMAQFAEQLPNLAGPYTHYPALDSTGLQGAWDFTLIFNLAPPGGGRNGGRAGTKGGGPAPPTGAGVASDPIGGMSLPEAVDKQLGLKLEPRQRTLPVLVIDHIEEQPTEN